MLANSESQVSCPIFAADGCGPGFPRVSSPPPTWRLKLLWTVKIVAWSAADTVIGNTLEHAFPVIPSYQIKVIESFELKNNGYIVKEKIKITLYKHIVFCGLIEQ